MTQIDLYRSATARAIEVGQAIRPDQLDRPTPCTAWTVQDLLDHLVGVADCLERLADPAARAHRSTSPLGFEWSGLEATAGTFMDVLVHTWDLAIATGQDATLDPTLVDACTEMFLPDMPENGRAAGLVGPAAPVASNASPQDQLLAAMGRRP